MFNLIVKVKLKRCTIVATKLNFHSHARGNKNILNNFEQYKDTLANEFRIPTDSAADIIIRSKLLTIPLEQIKRKCKLFQVSYLQFFVSMPIFITNLHQC